MKRILPGGIRPSEITPAEVFFNRRDVLAGALATGASALLSGSQPVRANGAPPSALAFKRNPRYSVNEAPNSFEDISSYNNFYEFGTDKSDPKENAHTLKPQPWSLTVAGEAETTGTYHLEDIL